MKGKVCLITGATNGIGKAAALALAKMGATVVIVGRNPDKTAATVAEIKAEAGSQNVDSLLADLGSLAQIRALAENFRAKYPRLDVLLNNAGVFNTKMKLTEDGYEQQFAVNHLAYFSLTALLLDMLKDSKPARIINVSSDAHRAAKWSTQTPHKPTQYSGFGAYGYSKLANIAFTYELAERLAGTGVTVNALHPGMVRTGFAHNNGVAVTALFGVLQTVMGLPPEQGADTAAYLASAPEVEGVTGKYWAKRKQVGSSKASYDKAAWKWLWELSEELVKKAPVTA